MRVAITREADKTEELTKTVRELGGEAVLLPMIETVVSLPPLLSLPSHCWYIFSSAKGVAALAQRDWPVPNIAIAVVGPATRRAVEQLGYTVAFESDVHTAAHLAATLPQTYLEAVWWCGNLADTAVHKELEKQRKIRVKSMEVYSTRATTPSKEEAAVMQGEGGKPLRAVVFMSGSAVRNWCAFGSLRNMQAICIGPSTVAVLKECSKDWKEIDIVCCEPHSMVGVKNALKSLLN